MKTTVQIFLFISLSFLVNITNAQIIHTDVDPDVVISIPVETFSSSGMDLDNDNKDDIMFQYTNYPSFSLWNLGVIQPDTNNPSIEILYDNSVPKSQIGDYYVKQLSANDNIASTSPYSFDYPQIGDIYNTNFNGGTGKYLGFRLRSGTGDFKYGWMAIELTGSGDMTFTITEYAFQSKVNTPIKAGQTTGVGIKHFDLGTAGISIYPNPTTAGVNIINIQGKLINSIQVYSMQGKLIDQWLNPTFPFRIESIDWDKGTYLVEMTGEGGTYREILVKN